MAKTIKKAIKKPVKAKAVEPKKAKPLKVVVTTTEGSDLFVTTERCVTCNGSGLERPTFAQSPACVTCNGLGVVITN